MRNLFIFKIVCIAALASFSSLQAQEAIESHCIETKAALDAEVVIDIDKVSETLGHLLVRQLDNPVMNFNMDKIIEGMKNGKAGKEAPMSESEYESQVLLIQEKIFQKTADTNLGEANSFLEKNSRTSGVVSLSPKLQYKIETQGEGEGVTIEGKPLIHYTGKLLNGTTFASSKESGTPIALSLKETIEGFNKGIVGMKKGEKRTLFVHPELAYGLVSHLPPNSLLIFEVELIDLSSAAAEVAPMEKAAS